jgi:hypothetical protein
MSRDEYVRWWSIRGPLGCPICGAGVLSTEYPDTWGYREWHLCAHLPVVPWWLHVLRWLVS